jgi:hypothetical protein
MDNFGGDNNGGGGLGALMGLESEGNFDDEMAMMNDGGAKL